MRPIIDSAAGKPRVSEIVWIRSEVAIDNSDASVSAVICLREECRGNARRKNPKKMSHEEVLRITFCCINVFLTAGGTGADRGQTNGDPCQTLVWTSCAPWSPPARHLGPTSSSDVVL